MLKKRVQIGPIAIDVGTTAVRLLQLAHGGREPIVHAAAFEEIPRDAWAGAMRADAVKTAIADGLRHASFRGRDTATCLSSGDFLLKSIRLPPMPAEEMASAVEFEAMDRFNIAAGTAQFRHIPAGEVRHGNELKQEIIVFAGLSEAIAARIALLQSLRLNPIIIDAAPCAMTQCFVRFLRRADDIHVVNVFLEVGYKSTAVVITHGADITFLKVVDVGGEHFNTAVAAALNVAPHEAARLRMRIMRQQSGRRGDDNAPVSDEICLAIGDALRASIERLSREVQLCLRYFAVTFRGQRPSSITFVGGEAHEPQLAKVIGESTDIPCTIGNPLRGLANVGAAGGPDRRTLAPAWATAVGLALHDAPMTQTIGRIESERSVEHVVAVGND